MKMVFVVIMMLVLSWLAQMVFCAETGPTASDVPRMTKEQLRAQMGNPDLVIIDVRSAHDWEDSKIKIMGSIREVPKEAGSWINKYPKNKTLVFY